MLFFASSSARGFHFLRALVVQPLLGQALPDSRRFIGFPPLNTLPTGLHHSRIKQRDLMREEKNPAPQGFAKGFHNFAAKSSYMVGTKWAFWIAVLIILAWAISGPYFHFSDTWQLVINTGTTIVTFLMVFLIQNTQNRDARAVHLKLDEIIRAIGKAHNNMINIENLSDEELQRLSQKFELLGQHIQPQRRVKSPKL